MKKSMLPALLVIFMHATLFAQSPAGPLPALPDERTISDSVSPIRTTLVTPVPSTSVPAPQFPSASAALAASAPRSRPAIMLGAVTTTGKALSNVLLDWELLTNGIVRQRGAIPHLSIAPQHSLLIRLPVRMPTGNEETFLHLRYFAAPPPATHSPLPSLLAEDWMPLRIWDGRNISVLPAGEMTFTDEDAFFTIHSSTLLIRFSKQTGWLQQYEIRGYNLLADSSDLRPDFRRMDTPDGPWQQVTRNPRLQLFSTSTGSEIVVVRTEYTLTETLCHLHLSYTINARGEIEIHQSIEADSTQQGLPLPRFGMQWDLPPALDSNIAYGRCLEHTDDPMAKKPPAEIYRPTIEEDRSTESTDVRWWKITGHDGRGFQIIADSGLLNIGLGPHKGTPLHIDYPAGAPPAQLPYASYQYGFKVSAVEPEVSPAATPAKQTKPVTQPGRQRTNAR